MLLDTEVTDEADERYRGHRYWIPLEEAAEKYGLNNLVGAQRRDFLQRGSPDQEMPQSASSEGSPGDEGEWVEVVEFMNMVDSVTERGGTYRGRLEIYVLGQAKNEYEGPIRTTPLAFADADGVGIPHVEPLIFNHEPSYPLRGVSPCERILPQLVELNTYRSKMAELTRRNARKYLYRKGALGSDEFDKLVDGTDGQGVSVDDKTVPLGDVVHMLPSPPPPAELWNYMNMVDQDYQASWGQTAPAAGAATDKGKTAYAVQIEQFWTETEIGYHGQVMTGFSRRLLRLLTRAVVRSMTSVEATAEMPKGSSVALLPQGSVPAEAGVSAEAAVVAQDGGAQAPAVVEGETAETAVAEGAAAVVETTGPKVQYVEWTVRDADGHPLKVTVDALDGDFDIKFLEGARTPMTDAAVLQFLSTQFADYMQKFQIVLKGGPEAVLARAWMKAEGERAQLPPELQVESLEERAKREMPKAPPPAADPKAPPGPAAFMGGGAPVPEGAPAGEALPEGGGAGQNAVVTALQSAAQALAAVGKESGDRAVLGAASLAMHAAQAAAAGDLDGMEAGVHGALNTLQGADVSKSPDAQHAAGILASVMRAAMQSGQEDVAPQPGKE